MGTTTHENFAGPRLRPAAIVSASRMAPKPHVAAAPGRPGVMPLAEALAGLRDDPQDLGIRLGRPMTEAEFKAYRASRRGDVAVVRAPAPDPAAG